MLDLVQRAPLAKLEHVLVSTTCSYAVRGMSTGLFWGEMCTAFLHLLLFFSSFFFWGGGEYSCVRGENGYSCVLGEMSTALFWGK